MSFFLACEILSSVLAKAPALSASVNRLSQADHDASSLPLALDPLALTRMSVLAGARASTVQLQHSMHIDRRGAVPSDGTAVCHTILGHDLSIL
jgi:hypothetical protein